MSWTSFFVGLAVIAFTVTYGLMGLVSATGLAAISHG